jgi:CubicO group peptidase (beta-lactamase class C family)
VVSTGSRGCWLHTTHSIRRSIQLFHERRSAPLEVSDVRGSLLRVFGWIGTGWIVGRTAGQTFGKVATASFSTPLGMTSTRFVEAGEAIPSGVARALSCDEEGCSAHPHLFSHTYPAGLASSTAREMARFFGAVLEAQQVGGPLAELTPERFTHDPRVPGMSYGSSTRGTVRTGLSPTPALRVSQFHPSDSPGRQPDP